MQRRVKDSPFPQTTRRQAADSCPQVFTLRTAGPPEGEVEVRDHYFEKNYAARGGGRLGAIFGGSDHASACRSWQTGQ
jgi:hypothetical protein